MIDRVIISICGPSGAGKADLAKDLVKSLGRDMAVRIPADYFLKTSSYENYEEFMSTPFQYDWKLIEEAISHPLGTAVESPHYDFTKFKRISKTGGVTFIIKRYLIFDGIIPYPKSDYVILLTSDFDSRKVRLKERDKRWNTNVMNNWKKLELTYETMLNSKKLVHLKINDRIEKEVNLESILKFLDKRKVTS